MLQVLDQNGNDLLYNPLTMMQRLIPSGTVAIPVYATVQADERVRAVLDWNDGQQPLVYTEQDSPLVIQAQRALSFGTYNITLTAYDTDSPSPAQVKILFPWTIAQLNPIGPSSRNIYGPILPRDDGLPNTQTWNFDTDSDLRLLASNLKMLLITAKGERVMSPTYGTNIKRIIFDLNLASVETILQQEIAQAVAIWEPRVVLQSLDVTRDTGGRSVTVIATFLSRQNSKSLDVTLQFTQ